MSLSWHFAVLKPPCSGSSSRFCDVKLCLIRALTSNPSTAQQTGAEANRYDLVGNRLTRQTGQAIGVSHGLVTFL